MVGLKILTIDNDPAMLTFVSFALRQAGAEVIEADSAITALEALQHCQPHLIISDIGMPEYDGHTLMRHLRSSDCDCSPALIHRIQAIPETVRRIPADSQARAEGNALTAYAGDENRQQALEAGFQRHLAKPVDPEQLIIAIVELCLEPK
ncbi:response regulator [Leptolyngbya sp. AN03gr2]|uniref:response regulator n=1 Tax=Leptolyngbya sp. AN03gr2 TaxID=3423364 RepID=UPI003D31ADE5